MFQAALGRLAERAGSGAPLCVLAHSLGSVIASDHLWDLQRERHGASATGREVGATPLERGQTLAGFYTFGSPIALWSLRHRDFGRPIRVPHGEWLNFFDRDDVIASPLKPLNDAYAHAVTEDVEVKVGGALAGWNPLAHTRYWNDRALMRRIATSLVHVAVGSQRAAPQRRASRRSGRPSATPEPRP